MALATTHCQLRLRHPLQQHVGAEVELVVAERRDVEPDGVQRGNHLFALEHRGGDRRRQEVAGQHEQRRGAVARQVLFQGRDAGEASGAVDRHRRVDVVDLQDGQRRLEARRPGLVG